jgi:uncharacterized protein (UPF0332 family)
MFDWDDYFLLAEDLLKSKSDEACLRSSVSRAYYAAYNRAKDFAENKNLMKFDDIRKEVISDNLGGWRKRTAHESIREFLSSESSDDFKQVSIDLFRLHKSRIICDYKNNIRVTDANVSKDIQIAKNILAIIPR